MRKLTTGLMAAAVNSTLLKAGPPSPRARQSPGWSAVVAAAASVRHHEDAATAPLAIATQSEGDHLVTGTGGTLLLSRSDALVTMSEGSEVGVLPLATVLAPFSIHRAVP